MMLRRALFLVFLLSLNVFVSSHEGHSHHHDDEHDHDENEHDVEDSDFAEFGDDKNTFSKGTEEDHVEVREQTHFAKPKPMLIKDLPVLTFTYCVSCGYKQAFDQFSQFIREKYPEMVIEGTNYPPAPWKAYLAQAVNLLKMVAIVVVISGSNPFESLGFGYPAVLQWAQGNKLSACMMLFLLTNMLEGTLLATGAFEIDLGGVAMWSKLESGRVPAPNELMQLIDAQLALLGKIPAAGQGFGEFEEKISAI